MGGEDIVLPNILGCIVELGFTEAVKVCLGGFEVILLDENMLGRGLNRAALVLVVDRGLT